VTKRDLQPHKKAPVIKIFSGLALAGCLGILSGCIGMSPTHDLKPVHDKETLHLSQAFDYQRQYFTGLHWRYTLARGDYRPVARDANGVFYQGPARCFSYFRIDKLDDDGSAMPKTVIDCGIYLPDAKTMPAKVFTVLGTGRNNIKGDVTSDTGASNATDPSLLSAAVVPANSTLTPLQAGVAGGLSAGIVGAIADAQRGNFNFFTNQPGMELRQVLNRELTSEAPR